MAKRSELLSLLFCLLLPADAIAQNADLSALDSAGNWRVQTSEEYQRGFIMGVVDQLVHMEYEYKNSHAIRVGWWECLKTQTDASDLKVVDSYLDRNPSSNTMAPSVAVITALHEMCAPIITQHIKAGG